MVPPTVLPAAIGWHRQIYCRLESLIILCLITEIFALKKKN